jgi:hypothetical protein
MSKLQMAREAIEQSSGVSPLDSGEVRHLMEQVRAGRVMPVDERILATLAMLLMAVDLTEDGVLPTALARGPWVEWPKW